MNKLIYFTILVLILYLILNYTYRTHNEHFHELDKPTETTNIGIIPVDESTYNGEKCDACGGYFIFDNISNISNNEFRLGRCIKNHTQTGGGFKPSSNDGNCPNHEILVESSRCKKIVDKYWQRIKNCHNIIVDNGNDCSCLYELSNTDINEYQTWFNSL